jgi:protein-histidine N-methyltransferase
MSSFKFGFSGDDIEGSEDVVVEEVDFEGFMSKDSDVKPENMPRLHRFEELIPHTRISYSVTENENEKVPRRDFFDVKYQLMGQDELSATDEILLGSSDIQTETYEGGLKVWECSYDLVKVLNQGFQNQRSVLELGCGAAVPLTHVFDQVLRSNITGVKLTLADFNTSVLRLVTAPNMLLAWMAAVGQTEDALEGEVEITQELVNQFLQDLARRQIELQFVSGSWSPQFVRLLEPTKYDLVLASETIYSLDTVDIFTDTMLNCLNPTGSALIAAKKVYFGVGGGIPEFESELQKRKIPMQWVLEDKRGVGRGVLRINLK